MSLRNKFWVLIILLPLFVSLLHGIALAADKIGVMSVSRGNSEIAVSGKKITFSGKSVSSVKEDTLFVFIYLQEKQGSSWVTIDSAWKSANNAVSVSHSKSKTVGGGRYYRTRSYHQSITNGVAYGFYTYSTEKWVP